MTDFARLVLDADTRGLKQGQRELDRTGDQAQRTAREVDSSAGKMASAFKKVGVALVAAGIGNVLLDFGKKSVQAAIDAQEMESAFDVVFGNMAADVRAWAEETGNALGRSTQEIQRGALAFQELFGKALDPAQAAELSKQFAVLTQDLASFKNLSNEVAQQKLFSGLVGEAEPLRAVGVFLNETAVKAKATELGLAGVNGALTDQEKIVARAALIQEQLAAAQGDVIRTSDSAANQIKTMNAAVEELQVAIGQKLLPALTPLITLTADLVTVVAEAAQSFNVSTEGTKDFAEGLRVLGRFVASIAEAFRTFGNWVGWANEQMDAAYRRAIAVAGPIAQVVSLIERLGARSNAQQSANALLTAQFSTGFIAGELAAMGKGVEVINGPSGLPAVAANLGKVEASAKRAGVAIKAANDNIAAVAEAGTGVARFDADAALAAIGGRPLDEMEELEKAAGRYVKSLKDAEQESKTTTVAIADTFAQMSQRITSSLQGLANSIRSGDFLGILGGVLDVFTQLGSAGVFGKGLQGRLNSIPSADGGGFTGMGARSGGLDGKGGFLAMLHPRETVIDHTRGQGMGGRVHVTVGVDPATGNLMAFTDSRIAATAPAIAQGGAALAQAQMAQAARRRVR